VTFRNALSVRLRAGGERCRPAGRAHSQSLKHALQERRVPPWERGFVPLIHSGDELIAAAGLFVCEGFEAKPGEPGWMLVWRR
jgi:tRNA(Ile)-lysidine synthase